MAGLPPEAQRHFKELQNLSDEEVQKAYCNLAAQISSILQDAAESMGLEFDEKTGITHILSRLEHLWKVQSSGYWHLQMELKKAHGNYEKLKKAGPEINPEYEGLKEEHGKMKAVIDEQTTQINRLSHTSADQADQLDQAEQVIANLQEQLRKAEAQLAAYEAHHPAEDSQGEGEVEPAAAPSPSEKATETTATEPAGSPAPEDDLFGEY